MGETLRVRVLRVNKTDWSLDCRRTATPRSTPRLLGSSAPGVLSCWSRAAKGQKGGRWREGAVRVKASELGQKSGDSARWGRRLSRGDTCTPGLSRQLPPDPGLLLRFFTPAPLPPLLGSPPPPGPPSPDLERKPGRGAWEWPVREDESSSLQAAVRGPRPEPWPGAQEATHTLGEARRLRAPGQEQQHPRGGHNAALGLEPRPTWRPLLVQRSQGQDLESFRQMPRDV